MSNANDTQVGGTHYKNPFQHWDLCHELDLGYFEGQISKYITRHRFKKGKEDADKSLHFCDKLIELVTNGGRMPRHKMIRFARMSEYAQANSLAPIEYACVNSICNWQQIEDLHMLRDRIVRLIDECYGAEPGPGYVDQGKDLNTPKS